MGDAKVEAPPEMVGKRSIGSRSCQTGRRAKPAMTGFCKQSFLGAMPYSHLCIVWGCKGACSPCNGDPMACKPKTFIVLPSQRGVRGLPQRAGMFERCWECSWRVLRLGPPSLPKSKGSGTE